MNNNNNNTCPAPILLAKPSSKQSTEHNPAPKVKIPLKTILKEHPLRILYL